jgi:hypothetical protein
LEVIDRIKISETLVAQNDGEKMQREASAAFRIPYLIENHVMESGYIVNFVESMCLLSKIIDQL